MYIKPESADLAPAKFLIGMVFLDVFISVGGHVVFERGSGSVWVQEMSQFGEGKFSFDWGKWCICA